MRALRDYMETHLREHVRLLHRELRLPTCAHSLCRRISVVHAFKCRIITTHLQLLRGFELELLPLLLKLVDLGLRGCEESAAITCEHAQSAMRASNM